MDSVLIKAKIEKINRQEDFMSMLLDSIRDGLELVVDKTEEYSKIGKLKVDIFGIKRNIEKQFVELGGRVYEMIIAAGATDVAQDDECLKAVELVKTLEVQLKEKEAEIEKVKADKERERRERQDARKKEADIKDEFADYPADEVELAEEEDQKKKKK
jgi:hypothetical protein